MLVCKSQPADVTQYQELTADGAGVNVDPKYLGKDTSRLYETTESARDTDMFEWEIVVLQRVVMRNKGIVTRN